MLIKKVQRAIEILQNRGWTGFSRHFQRAYRSRRVDEDYQKWIRRYDTLTDADRELIKQRIAEFSYKPLISVLTPVYNIEEKWLRLCIESVLKQLYPHWELCLADDCSTKPHVRKVLEEYAASHSRIKIVFREENGHISAASNSALKIATGEFCALLDHDDELSEHALYFIAEELNAHPQADMLYSDEDMIDENGRRYDGKFKPDWSPDFFHAVNLVTHLSVYRTEVMRKVGGFRLGLEGSQDYDLALRVTEQIPENHIRHIPHILYHWRAIPGSVALDANEKSYAHEKSRRAINEHFERTETPVQIVDGFKGFHRVIYKLPEKPPLVSLILMANGKNSLVESAVKSVLDKTDYENFEIIVAGSNIQNLEKLRPAKRVVFIEGNSANLAELNNLAANKSNGEVLCFLDQSVELITADWLKELTAHALRSQVGAVGAKLLYADGIVRHAGVILGIKGVCANAHQFHEDKTAGYYLRAALTQNFSAVSGACLAVRKKVFLEVEAFNQKDLPNGLYDVDFCLRLGEAGYRILWTPHAKLYQTADSSTEKMLVNSVKINNKEITYFKNRWKYLLAKDPYYNENLTLERADFSLAMPPRTRKPWQTAVK